MYDKIKTKDAPPNWIEMFERTFYVMSILTLIFIVPLTLRHYRVTETKIMKLDAWDLCFEPILPFRFMQSEFDPEQLHLSLGTNDSEIYVTWSTMSPTQCQVFYRELLPGYKFFCKAVDRMLASSKVQVLQVDTEPESRSPRKLYSYLSKLTNLTIGAEYTYRVQCENPKNQSIKYYSYDYNFVVEDFSNHEKNVSLAFYGDLGLINGQSIKQLTKDVEDKKYDLIIHNGDFAYDLNDDNGKRGDSFMRRIQPIAARLPYQVSVGNHEIAQNFSHYDHRFNMFSNVDGNRDEKPNNFFYSFNAGPIHFVAISTEFYYFLDYVGLAPLVRQYDWLQQDLKQATSPKERALRPWIIVFGHRPMYCSSRDNDDCSKDSNILRKGLPFIGAYALEKLFYDYGVDVELYSHEHQYERFLPIYNSTVFNGTDDPQDPYHNPKAPVHVISGSAGCQEKLDPFKGQPVNGSVKQIVDYGYTHIRASRCKLFFEQISDDQKAIVDSFVISKKSTKLPLRLDTSI